MKYFAESFDLKVHTFKKMDIESRSKFTHSLKSGGAALWSFDFDKRTFYWSKELNRLHSFKKKSFSGNLEFFTSTIHPFDKERFIQRYQTYTKTGDAFRITYRILHKNDSFKYIELRGKTFLDNKKPLYTHGVALNVTDSKKQERRIDKTVRKIESILKNIPEGIVVEMPSGSVSYANDAFFKLFDIAPNQDLSGLKISEILRKFEIKDLKDNVIKNSDLKGSKMFLTYGKKRKTFLFTNPKKDISKYLRIENSIISTEDSSAQLYVKVFQNVTKDIEEKMNTQVSLGVISHELKNALTGLKGYIHLVNRRIEMNDYKSAKSYLISLTKESNRIIKLINDLFDVSRIRLGFLRLNKRPFNYSEILNNTIVTYRTNNRFTIKQQIDPDLLIYADRDRIMQVLYNLVSNAIKYSNSHNKIHIKAYKHEGNVITEIKDYGVGIPKNKMREIFKLYKRVNNSGTTKTKGLGIGLFITKGIIDAHKGTIKVKSKEGKGSMFSVSIPAAN